MIIISRDMEAFMNRPIINRSDFALLKLLPGEPRLQAKLVAARVLPAHRVPMDVVTMNSKVKFRDAAQGAPRCVTLVYPTHADGTGRISVLSPLGTALLGAAIGEELEADIAGAGRRLISVQDIVSQPEREARRRTLDEKLDHALKHTFPASDAFSFTLGF
jgi:regulator of nucleoside diphosphate kinase